MTFLVWSRPRGLVDPDFGGKSERSGCFPHETLGMLGVGAVKNRLSASVHVSSKTKVDHGWGEHTDPGVAVLVVVPGKKTWQ